MPRSRGVRGEIALVIDAPGETGGGRRCRGGRGIGCRSALSSWWRRACAPRRSDQAPVAEFGISRNGAYNLAMEAAR